MAENRSDKACFESRFGGGWLTASQYLAENMCDRMARKDKTSLPAKFWDTSDLWKRHFLQQIRSANSLLKLYSIEAILRGLRHPKGKNVFSLGARWLDPIIKDEQRKIDIQAEKLTKAIAQPEPAKTSPIPHNTAPRPVFQPKASSLDKLRNLE